MYLLDSCICIEFLRGRMPHVYELFEQSDASLFKIPTIVQAELLLGAEKSPDPRQRRRKVEEFLNSFEIVPFDSACAYEYAHIRAELELEGLRIDPNDLIIAATAVANHSILVTNNVKEFKRVPGLSLESWYEVDLNELLDDPDPDPNPDSACSDGASLRL